MRIGGGSSSVLSSQRCGKGDVKDEVNKDAVIEWTKPEGELEGPHGLCNFRQTTGTPKVNEG